MGQMLGPLARVSKLAELKAPAETAIAHDTPSSAVETVRLEKAHCWSTGASQPSVLPIAFEFHPRRQ
jgi:hypothetical protein